MLGYELIVVNRVSVRSVSHYAFFLLQVSIPIATLGPLVSLPIIDRAIKTKNKYHYGRKIEYNRRIGRNGRANPTRMVAKLMQVKRIAGDWLVCNVQKCCFS